MALVVLRHHDFGKPALEAGGLKQHVAELLGLALRVVENQPAAREEIAVQIVEVIALQGRFHVALIRIARIVGVFPLPPMVLAVQLLRHVPAAHGRVERVQGHPRALRRETSLVVELQAQARPVLALRDSRGTDRAPQH